MNAVDYYRKLRLRYHNMGLDIEAEKRKLAKLERKRLKTWQALCDAGQNLTPEEVTEALK